MGTDNPGYLMFLQVLSEYFHSVGWRDASAASLDDESVHQMWEEGYSPEEAAQEMMRE